MPETKIQGYVISVTPKGAAYLVKIGKKLPIIGFVGEQGALTRAEMEEALRIFRIGDGTIRLGDAVLTVSTPVDRSLGVMRLAALRGKSEASICLLADDKERILAVVSLALQGKK